jgi:hypothetical protein
MCKFCATEGQEQDFDIFSGRGIGSGFGKQSAFCSLPNRGFGQAPKVSIFPRLDFNSFPDYI